ncbi:MAG: hypothetical protein Q8N79_00725, partial [Candidatus Methanoperedens sp.]|nr:hypothetical protein [Candidatus Methanoperedens sp.]
MKSVSMIVTRHISLDNDCIKKMEPYVEKHKGNFSSAIREIIDRAGKNSTYDNLSTVDNSLFKWMLNEIDGVLIPDNVLDELIDPRLINSMQELEEYLNRKFSELEWDIDLALKYDNDASPSDVLVEIRGSPQKIKFVASLISQFLVKNSLESIPLKIMSVVNFNDCLKVVLSRSSERDAIDSLNIFFGEMNEVIKAIKSHPDFWKALINRHHLSNYNMVTIHRNYFEDLLAGKVPMGEITIETLAKKPIQEIPFKEMLSLIKEVYETSRVADRVEIDKENIILFHNYRNKDVIEKLKMSLLALLEANGHLYDAKSTSNMIILTHKRDVGIKYVATSVVGGTVIGAVYYFPEQSFLAFVTGWLFLISAAFVAYMVYGLREYLKDQKHRIAVEIKPTEAMRAIARREAELKREKEMLYEEFHN